MDGPVESLFRGHELKLFHLVRQYIETHGPVKAEATKTQVSFGTGKKFTWIWLPPAWAKNRPKESIVLTFGLGHQIRHERIVKAVEPYPGRFTHHVIIDKESDLSTAVKEWLQEAYAFSQR